MRHNFPTASVVLCRFHNMDQEDTNYLAMLNNATINPSPQQQQRRGHSQQPRVKTQADTFPALESVQQSITSVSRSLSLVSETDAQLEWISAHWTHDHLPSAQELVELGWTDSESASICCKTKSIDEFLEPIANDEQDPYGQAADFRALLDKFRQSFKDPKESRVYLLGERSITVLMIGLVRDDDAKARALAGLRSLLVET